MEMYLNLRQPLNYTKIKALPSLISENDEFLLCCELNPAQAASIEPEKEKLLGNLLFTAKMTAVSAEDAVNLPAGRYIFSQCRRETPLNQEEWLDMAVELQKDGLWERNKLENQLFVRFLYEDGKFVTQIFRAIS